MTEYQNLSEKELQAVIERAEQALKNKQANKRKEIIAKIKELAASIDVGVEIHELGKKTTRTVRTGSKVPVKYRHPNDPSKTWTGRGMTPKWMLALMDKGHDRNEFLV
jgi:DNA-binding protein H-NS